MVRRVNFSGLVSAVQEFWSFFWPAAVCLAILLGIIKRVAPVTAKGLWDRVQGLRPSDGTQVSAFKTIKRYGFDKLVPFLVAFC